MAYCIPKEIIEEVKDILTNTVSSSGRIEKLTARFGAEQAQNMNLLYERTLQSVNKELSLEKLITKMTMTPAKKAEILENFKKNMARRSGVLDDQELTSIVKDIIDRKYNIKLSPEESLKILRLQKEVKATLSKGKNEDGNYDPQYGEATFNLNKYISEIKNPTQNMTLGDEIKFFSKQGMDEFSTLGVRDKFAFAGSKLYETTTSPIFKAMKVTLDASFITIQGAKIITTSPTVFIRSLKASWKGFTQKEAVTAFKMDMFAWGQYEEAIKSGLRVSDVEEQFDSFASHKIWGIGGAVARSDSGFTMFLQTARKQEYSRMKALWEAKLGRKLDIDAPVKAGEVSDAQYLQGVATHANKISGTSNLGSAEKYAEAVNRIMFAGRFAVSDVRMYTDILNFKGSALEQQTAIRTLAQHLAVTLGTYSIIAYVNGQEPELRPNAANFMKIKGDNGTYYESPMASKWFLVLMTKLAFNEEINKKGKTIEYGEGFKPKTRGSVIMSAARRKLAPVPSVIADFAVGEDVVGNEATLGREAVNLAAPIFPAKAIERLIDNEEDVLEQIKLNLFDFLGAKAFNPK